MTIESMPCRLRRWASMSPAGPAPTMPTWVCMLRVSLSARLERERPLSSLHGDPPHLGELVHREGVPKATPSAVLDATERHLWLIVHRLVVHVHDPGIGATRHRGAAASSSTTISIAHTPNSAGLKCSHSEPTF